MDFSETSEQAILRDAIRKIAAGYGHDYYAKKSRAGEKSVELWAEMGRKGFIGVNIPEEYGGGGLGIYELTIVVEELAAAGCPLLLLIVSPAICGSIITRCGSKEQKERWLPGIASGEFKMAFAITEPDAGSNSHELSTAAVRDRDGYRMKGTKYYISGFDEAQAVLVVAKTGVDPATRRGDLSLFVVDTHAPGLTAQHIPVEIVAPEKQFTLFFDDVRVPLDNLIGKEGEGLRNVFFGLNPERITAAAISNGIARYALAKASAYANERRVWRGVPIGAHQGIAHPLAEAKIQAELARLMTAKAATLYDQGLDAGEAANMAKYSAAEAAIEALDQAIQTHGGNGIASEYGLADLWGAARLLRTAPVSREMILNFVAEHSLGLPKSY
jgi:alkylation response protein AidB-like acyl-CoA dehydrogenase